MEIPKMKTKRRRVLIEVETPLSRSEFGKAVLEIAKHSFENDLQFVEIAEQVGDTDWANDRLLYQRR